MSKWQLPRGWEWQEIGNVIISISTGTTPPSKIDRYYDGGFPWFTPGDIGTMKYLEQSGRTISQDAIVEKKARIFTENTLLITCIGNIGRVGILQSEASANQQITGIGIDQGKLLTDFVYWWFRCNYEYLQSLAPKAVIPILNQENLKKISIPVPYPDDPPRSLATQRRIVARIEALLAEVREMRELQESITSDTKRLRQAVINDAFRKGIESGWNWQTVGGLIADKPQYGTSQKANTDGVGVPVLRMGNIQDGELNFDDMKFIQLPDVERDKYLLNSGDLLFNRSNGSIDLVGKTAVFRANIPMIFASYLIRAIPDPRVAIPEYMSEYINSGYGREYIVSNAVRSTGQANVNAAKLSAMPIPIPSSLNEQRRLVGYIHSAMEEIHEMQQLNVLEKQRIEDLESAILTTAFRGEL